MNSRERVLKTIKHEPVDRIPLTIWFFREDVRAMAVKKYGSLDVFYETLGIDMFMGITPPPSIHNPDFLEEKMTMDAADITLADVLDPDREENYAEVKELLGRYRGEKAIAAHVWGVVEGLYIFIGVEETLALMAAEPERAQELFGWFAEFSRRTAENLCSLGIDILHISGDVGSNGAMLFSPDMWREQVRDFDAAIMQPGKDAGVALSLHSCGYYMPVFEGFIDMGIELFHPIQESAGMSLREVKDKYGDQVAINGSLDVRDLPKMNVAQVEAYVKEKIAICKPGGGFIFNTGHTVQPDTDLDVLEAAYRMAQKLGAY